MSKLLSIVLKFLLVLLLVALLALAGYWLHIRFDWTPLMLAGLFAGTLGFCLLVFLIRRIYYRRREEHFIRSMVDTSAPALKLQEEENNLEELRRKWRKGIGILQRSRLSLTGNPVYSLPWFMVFGESGAGKSTAISHARLSASASQAGPLAHVPHTRNCDWWFFEDAVILDTAGRYADSGSPESDEREWEELLDLLASTRRKEPLNGLVLTVPAERLIRENASALADYGRHVRMHMETMSRILGARVPVYIMVTKMDHVLGMTEFAGQLTAEERNQALGLLNKDADSPPLEFLDEAMLHVQGRLRDMGMVLAARRGGQDGRAALFAEEFSLLKPGLAAFARGAFAPSPYSEKPMLRGLFFSSGRQQGFTAAHKFAGLATFKEHTWRLPDTDSALFLHNFFAAILPRERGLMQFLDSYLSRISITRNLGYLVWLCLFFALCSYFTVSFMENRADMELLSRGTAPLPEAGDSLQVSVIKLNAIVDVIDSYSVGITDNWWYYPGKKQTQDVLKHLHWKYAEWMRTRLFQQSDSITARTLELQQRENRRLTLAMLCEYLTWTMDAMKAVAEGKTPPPPADDITAEFFNQAGLSIPLNDHYFNRSFIAYVRWEEPQYRGFVAERTRATVQRYMAMLGDDLSWLTDWLETRRLLSPVPLSRYWSNADETSQVSRAFTPEALERVDAMLTRLEEASANKAVFRQRADLYKKTYASHYRQAWRDMAARFSQGPSSFTTAEEWRASAMVMSTPDNPYFAFIRDMAEALAAIRDIGVPDERDELAALFVALAQEHQKRAATATGGQPQSLQQLAKDKKQELEIALHGHKAETLSRIAEGVGLFSQYMELLRKVYLASRTDNDAMILASAGFAGGAEASKTPVAAAMATLGELEATLDPRAAHNRVFWELVEGPLAFHTALAVTRAGCHMNGLWQSNVLSFVRRYPPESRWGMLFGEQGRATEFINGPARPFLRHGNGQWLPATWAGLEFPARDDFLSFLDIGQFEYSPPQPEYRVNISALPVNVNDTADKPYQVRLSLRCGHDLQQLDNLNYPVSKVFTWKPGQCGDTMLAISFPSVTVHKVWPGANGFQNFLADFQGSSLYLLPADFPSGREQLADMDVTHIAVRYDIDGADGILALSDPPALDSLPPAMAMCRSDLATGGSDGRLAPLPIMLPASPPAAAPKAPKSAGPTTPGVRP